MADYQYSKSLECWTGYSTDTKPDPTKTERDELLYTYDTEVLEVNTGTEWLSVPQ